MDEEARIITHPKFRMWLRPDGIVQMVWVTKDTSDLEDAIAAISAMNELTGGRRSSLLADVHNSGQQTRPARLEFACRDDLVSALALIASTPLSRVLGNFYLRVNKPLYPARLFDNEASALAWLQAIVVS